MVVLGTSLVVQVVKTSPSSAGDAGSISGQKPKKKTWNRNNIETNLIKTLKKIHIKKKLQII